MGVDIADGNHDLLPHQVVWSNASEVHDEGSFGEEIEERNPEFHHRLVFDDIEALGWKRIPDRKWNPRQSDEDLSSAFQT